MYLKGREEEVFRKVAFIYNTVPDAVRTGVFAECASQMTVSAVEQALLQGGNEIIPINLHSRAQLEQVFTEGGKPDFAFVIAEGFLDQPETLYDGSGAALVRETLAELNVPTSHSSVAAMELCRNKELTYQVLQQQRVSCPWHVNLSTGNSEQAFLIEPDKFPLFVKPSGGGNSVGIDAGSVVYNQEQLAEQIRRLYLKLGEVSLIAETFLVGNEYTVGVIGNLDPVVLPAVAFPENLVRTSEVKKMEARNEVPVYVIDPTEPLYFRLRELALQTYIALGCADAIRIDVKSDAQGNLYVIDVNGTPSLSPTSSLARSATAVNLNYPELINLLLNHGMQRAGTAGAESEQVRGAEDKLSVLRVQEVLAC